MTVYISPIKQYIIDAVTAFRYSRNITQSEMGSVIGTNRTFIANIERGSYPHAYNLTHLNAIAFYFDVPLYTFLPVKALPEKEVQKKWQVIAKQSMGISKTTKWILHTWDIDL